MDRYVREVNADAQPPFTNWAMAAANLSWMDNNMDLGGYSRIDRFSGIVDIGAYEFIPRGTVIKIY